MQQSEKEKITRRLPSLIKNITRFDPLIDAALEKGFLKQDVIDKWENEKYSDYEKKKDFFLQAVRADRGFNTDVKFGAMLLQTNNFDVIEVLDIKDEDYKEEEGEVDLSAGREYLMAECEKIVDIDVKPAIDRYGGKQFDRNEFYRMESTPRGLALVLVNINFDKESLKRTGAANDLNMMTNLLKKLDYEVDDYKDQEKQDFEDIVDEFVTKVELNNVDSCVVAISSHGASEGFYCTDGKIYLIEKLKQQFNNANCEGLKGKPTVFFIQACRGNYHDAGASVDSTDDVSDEVFGPRITDLFVEYSCQSGYVSHLNKTHGSWFFYAVTKIFMEFARQDHYYDLMRKVHLLIDQLKSSQDGQKQSAESRMSGSCKKLYFNPGL